MATLEEIAAFQRRANMPWIWQIQAHTLIAAANVLWKRYRHVVRAFSGRARRLKFAGELQPWPALMLDGFAVENLLKGLLLARGQRATRGDRLDRAFKTHLIVPLCNKANIALSGDEEELLHRVKRMMEIGRYPVGATAGTSWALRLELPREPDMIMNVLQRIDDEFRRTSRDGSVEEDLQKLGVRLVPVDAITYYRQIALHHGQRIDGSAI